MINRTLEEIERMVQGWGLAETYKRHSICGVSIDSRTAERGNLFIPIIRVNDGHRYAAQALERGAAALLWQEGRPNPPENVPVIFVKDTTAALQSLAKSYREQLPVKVVGVTGSNGKTTVKDMIHSVLSTVFSVQKTKGNLNSQFGLPLTLLELREDTEAVVLEMGMSERGQIKRLSEIAQPDAAVITMIGVSHLASLGSREEIARAKLEIAEGLKRDALLVINGDEPLLAGAGSLISTGIRMVTFGEGGGNDYFPVTCDIDDDGTVFTENRHPGAAFRLPMPGKHNVLNALAAIAVAEYLRVTSGNMAIGLKDVRITAMRMEKVRAKSGFTLYNDAWNASPVSMKAAIETLYALTGYSRKFAVLGDMLELGEAEVEYHREIGRLLDPNRIDYVLTVGHLGRYIAEEAKGKFPHGHAIALEDNDAAVETLKKLVTADDAVLVKGSRALHLEDIILAFK